MATPVVHDGVPVAIRERENSLKHSEEEKQLQVFFLSLSRNIGSFISCLISRVSLGPGEIRIQKEKSLTKKYPKDTRD